jgi:purine-binding chemotaxis protein CheW
MGLTSLSARLPRVREEVEQVKQLVSFRIGDEEFGVDILMVQEIIRLTTITPIPNASRAILGMINLRGNIIPIVDLRWYLRLNEGSDPDKRDRKARILIIELGNHVTGFVVDAVSEVIKVPVGNIEPTPDLVSSSVSSAYIQGVIKMAGRLIILLDFTQILRAQEKRELEHFESQTALIEFDASNRDTDIRLNLSDEN